MRFPCKKIGSKSGQNLRPPTLVITATLFFVDEVKHPFGASALQGEGNQKYVVNPLKNIQVA